MCRANVELTCTVRDECTSFTFYGYAGTVATSFNEKTTHVLSPRGVSNQSDLQSLESAPSEAVHLVPIDWLSALIGERKQIPAKEFEVEKYLFCFTRFTSYWPLSQIGHL